MKCFKNGRSRESHVSVSVADLSVCVAHVHLIRCATERIIWMGWIFELILFLFLSHPYSPIASVDLLTIHIYCVLFIHVFLANYSFKYTAI